MDAEKLLSLAPIKTRDQLLSEYREVKRNPYFIMFSAPVFLVILVCAVSHYSDKTFVGAIICIAYIVFEILLSSTRANKKIRILYEIEKSRNNEINMDERKK
jgi:hypothetical protein